MIRISAPHFVAGAVLNDDHIVMRAAPIIVYMRGWTATRAINYCLRKGWTWEYLS